MCRVCGPVTLFFSVAMARAAVSDSLMRVLRAFPPVGLPRFPGLFDVLSQHHPGVRHKPLASVEVAVGY